MSLPKKIQSIVNMVALKPAVVAEQSKALYIYRQHLSWFQTEKQLVIFKLYKKKFQNVNWLTSLIP